VERKRRKGESIMHSQGVLGESKGLNQRVGGEEGLDVEEESYTSGSHT
jgi:hypothetical protein